MGTPQFAVPSLQKLIESNHDVISVVTRPDKPEGRGRKIRSCPVKLTALQHKLPISEPESLRDPQFIQYLQNLSPDIIAVVAFRILPRSVFEIPVYGTINLHASLLPWYRGAAPIHWALINGETKTGVTTFKITQKVDTGNLLMKEEVEIYPDETNGELSERLSHKGADLLLKTIDSIRDKTCTETPQPEGTFPRAPKINKEDCRIDWSLSSERIHNFIRGLSPVPTAFTTMNEKIYNIYRSKIVRSEHKNSDYGIVVQIDKHNGIIVQTGKGQIAILELQKEGKRRLSAQEYLKGSDIAPGDLFK